jgi:hypothetical protein
MILKMRSSYFPKNTEKFSALAREFVYSAASRPGLGPIQPYISWVRWPGREAEHSI